MSYRCLIVANALEGCDVQEFGHNAMSEFLDQASAGFLVGLHWETSPEIPIATLIARGVRAVSLVVLDDWPGLTFDNAFDPGGNAEWQLALHTAHSWYDSR